MTKEEILRKYTIFQHESMELPLASILYLDGRDEYTSNRAYLIKYCDTHSSNNEDEFFWEWLSNVKFVLEGATAYTTIDKIIALNMPMDMIPMDDNQYQRWYFVYCHECLHQLWNTFGVGDKIIEKHGSCDHQLLNIASDCVINDYLTNINKKDKMPPNGGITPEAIEEHYGIKFDRNVDTQYTLYMKLHKLNKDIQDALKDLFGDPQQSEQSGKSNQSSKSNQPNQPGQSGMSIPSKGGQASKPGNGKQSGSSSNSSNPKDNAKQAAEEAAKAAEDAKKAADKANKEDNKGASKAANEASKRAEDAAKKADEAAKAAEEAEKKAKEAEKNGDKKAAEEAAEEAAKAAEEAAKAAEDAKKAAEDAKKAAGIDDENSSDSNNNNSKNKKGSNGEGDFITNGMIDRARERGEKIIRKYSKKLTGSLGDFVKKCQMSEKLNSSGLMMNSNRGSVSWDKELEVTCKQYVKQKLKSKKKYRGSYERPRRGAIARDLDSRKQDPVLQGKKEIKNKIGFDLSMYIDISASMTPVIDNVFESAIDVLESLKKSFGKESNVDKNKINLKSYVFNTRMKEIPWGNKYRAQGGTYEFEKLISDAVKNGAVSFLNIIITDGEFGNINEGEVIKLLKETQGLFVIVTNADEGDFDDLVDIVEKHCGRKLSVIYTQFN